MAKVVLVVVGSVVLVEDDGRGPDGRSTEPSHGFGLPGLADRAERLGGTCVLEERPGGGARLRWSVPLRAQRATD